MKILLQIIKKMTSRLFQNRIYTNGVDTVELDKKVLSNLLGSNVNDWAISSDFSTIACWCTKKEKMKFLKMRKYLKANPEHLIAHKMANVFNINQ